MSQPKTTVYCISHDYGDFLEQAVESVLTQTTDNWELLLIDNASEDKTSSIIDYYRNDLSHKNQVASYMNDYRWVFRNSQKFRVNAI